MNSFDTIAISHPDDVKIASLFFDYVLPLIRPYGTLPLPSEILFPEWEKYIASYDDLLVHLLQAEEKYRSVKEKSLLYFYHNDNILGIRRRLAKDKLRSVPIFTDGDYFNYFNTQNPEKSLEITLSDIPIINVEKMTWEHITEVRQDRDFKRNTRNFRLFILDNYEGKSKNYILDSLAKKLDDYESSCKKHGVELTFSTVKTAMDSQSILATLGITAAAILLGQPIIAGGTLLAGVSIEIGKIALHVLEKKTAMKFIKNESDIAYLYSLKKRAESVIRKKSSAK